MKTVFISNPFYSRVRPVDFEGNVNKAARKLPDACLYLAAAEVKRHGIAVKVFDTSEFNGNKGLVENFIKNASKTDALILHYDRYFRESGTKLAGALKKLEPDIPVILFGIYPTVYDIELMKNNEEIDFIVRGDVEIILPDLLKSLEGKNDGTTLDNLKNLTWRKNGEIFRNEDGRLISERKLNQLPYPLYDRLQPDTYDNLVIETSRGVPFYDHLIPNHPALKTWRAISSMGIFERLYKSAEYMSHKSKNPVIIISDPHFTAKEKRVYDFLQVYTKKRSTFKIEYFSRCSDIIHGSLASYIAPFTAKIRMHAGCGYNSGLLKLKKGFLVKDIVRSSQIFAEKGMRENASYVFTVGYPWETQKEIQKTIQTALDLKKEYGVESEIFEYDNSITKRLVSNDYGF